MFKKRNITKGAETFAQLSFLSLSYICKKKHTLRFPPIIHFILQNVIFLYIYATTLINQIQNT
ncbi:hypothetical protein IW22_17910 [Chryseobacterium sp. JM1]|nr:hypothetical protein IW22_17910 [Chryseobacterium sp. JM1]